VKRTKNIQKLTDNKTLKPAVKNKPRYRRVYYTRRTPNHPCNNQSAIHPEHTISPAREENVALTRKPNHNTCRPRSARGSTTSPVKEAAGTESDGEQILGGRVERTPAKHHRSKRSRPEEHNPRLHPKRLQTKWICQKQKENNNKTHK
jgi:hypothetical protein